MKTSALTPHQLRIFVAVAEHLHFGQAARSLGMSQPPLSQQLKRMEDHIGAPLFDRTNRRVALTDVGTALLDEARGLLDRLERFDRRAQQVARGEGGVLRLGYVGPALAELVAPAVGRLRQRRPGVRVELARLGSERQVAMVEQGDLHLGVVRLFGRDVEPLVRQPLWSEDYVAAVPVADPLAEKRRLRLRDFAGRELIAFRRQTQPALFDRFAAAVAEFGVAYGVPYAVDTKEEAVALVGAGLGCAFVPRSSATPYRGVEFRPVVDSLPSVELFVIHRDPPSAMVEGMLGALQAQARARRRACAPGGRAARR